jgi:diketogulonate reductase-like aldo/keto reductase
MAQVAVNWVATQPGVATVLVAATKLHQLQDNLTALDFTIPIPLRERLDKVSAPARTYPYSFFDPMLQNMVTGGANVGDKPAGYGRNRMLSTAQANSKEV